MKNLETTLINHGIKNIRYAGSSIQIPCIFHEETQPSLTISSRGYKCFGCGASGSLEHLFIELGILEAPVFDTLNTLKEKLVNRIQTKLHCIGGLLNAKPYTGEFRGITSQTFLENGAFTIDTDDDSICFPLYTIDNEYNGYVKYTFGKKYKNFPLSGYTPFNLHRLHSNSPIIVEGIFDLLSVYQLGYHNILAILGTGNVYRVSKILRELNAVNVHILFDADDSGSYYAKKLSELYKDSTIIEIPDKGEDPNSYKFLKELLETEYDGQVAPE